MTTSENSASQEQVPQRCWVEYREMEAVHEMGHLRGIKSAVTIRPADNPFGTDPMIRTPGKHSPSLWSVRAGSSKCSSTSVMMTSSNPWDIEAEGVIEIYGDDLQGRIPSRHRGVQVETAEGSSGVGDGPGARRQIALFVAVASGADIENPLASRLPTIYSFTLRMTFKIVSKNCGTDGRLVLQVR